jgi:hypothetical protein
LVIHLVNDDHSQHEYIPTPGGERPRGAVARDAGGRGHGRAADRKLLPIEVKATARPRLTDCTHLRTFRAEYGSKARAGLL